MGIAASLFRNIRSAKSSDMGLLIALFESKTGSELTLAVRRVQRVCGSISVRSTELMTTVVALVVRYARRPAALTQSYCSADISTNARRPWRVISIGLQRAYRRNASNSRRNFKIVIMAMTIVRYFDRFACLLRVGDVALCRYSIKSLELSAAKFLSRNTRSAATSHLSQSTTSVRSA